MRQAINNLQSTWSGFGFISSENVFKVCDQPHPIIIQSILDACQKSDIDTAMEKIQDLWDQGYSAVDVVVTIFRVVKASDKMPEYTKLEFIKVAPYNILDSSILKGASLGDRMDPYAYLGRCRDPCPTWRSHGPSLQSGSWSHWSVSHDCQAERHLNFTGDEARLIPDIKKHLTNTFMFSGSTSLALLPMLSCLPYYL